MRRAKAAGPVNSADSGQRVRRSMSDAAGMHDATRSCSRMDEEEEEEDGEDAQSSAMHPRGLCNHLTATPAADAAPHTRTSADRICASEASSEDGDPALGLPPALPSLPAALRGGGAKSQRVSDV